MKQYLKNTFWLGLVGALVLIFLATTGEEANAENKISTRDHYTSAKGETKAGTGELVYSKDHNHKIEGKYSEKFVLGHGDCSTGRGGSSWNDCVTDRGRVERHGGYSFSRNKWYKFSIFVDPNWDKASKASIAQVKVKNLRFPVWMLRIDNGQLKMEMNTLKCYKSYLVDLKQLAGSWNDIVIYVNYSKKATDWSRGAYTMLWVNGERKDLGVCGELPVLSKYSGKFNKKGSSFRYGIYHSYVSRELDIKAKTAGVDMNLPGCNDVHKGLGHTSRSVTCKPWEVKWPVKLETKRIWFDDMQDKASKKNIWNMDLSIKPKTY